MISPSSHYVYMVILLQGQAKRSISCRGGLTVQAVAASGPAAPEPGQSRPADQRFHQLALPNEGRARKKEGYGKDCYNIIKEGDCRYVFFSS